jgi:hypothetical protein
LRLITVYHGDINSLFFADAIQRVAGGPHAIAMVAPGPARAAARIATATVKDTSANRRQIIDSVAGRSQPIGDNS